MRSLYKKFAAVAILACLLSSLLAPVASASTIFPDAASPSDSTLTFFIENFSHYLEAGNLGTSVTPLVLTVALLGIVLAFFGYPLLRLTIFLGGFGTGIAAALFLLKIERLAAALTSPWMPLVVMLLCGAICAWLFCKLFTLALFFTVCGATLMMGMGPIKALFPSPIGGILAAIAAAIVLGLLATRFVRPVIVLTTAAAGGFLVSLALSGVIPVPHIKLVLFALVLVLGLAVQFRTREHAPRIN